MESRLQAIANVQSKPQLIRACRLLTECYPEDFYTEAKAFLSDPSVMETTRKGLHLLMQVAERLDIPEKRIAEQVERLKIEYLNMLGILKRAIAESPEPQVPAEKKAELEQLLRRHIHATARAIEILQRMDPPANSSDFTVS